MRGTTLQRRLPIGAEVLPNGIHFRVWAPAWKSVQVVVEGRQGRKAHQLSAEENGYFSAVVAGLGPGTLYRYQLGSELYPDPASRFQPDGPHGPSEAINPGAFPWTDTDWGGIGRDGQVIYEMHVGTFTRQGTWDAAAQELAELAHLGVTTIEVMPVADFPGKFGWGYDGVNLFAPTRLYGRPDDFRRFVDRAHAARLAVILDVVYNHIGPDGNYLKTFAPTYFTDRYKGEWGEAINFDGKDSAPVRELFVGNAGYWIDEFHLDGLRLDATQQMFDESDAHILADIGRRVREAAQGRDTFIVAENDPQHAHLVRSPAEGGHGLDALWNDDFQHSARVALTGRREAYYSDYLGTPQELVSAVKWGYLYQGQRSQCQKKPRGTPALALPPAAFVSFLENHDQVANSALGLRCHQLGSPGRYRALTALLLLAPGTPMLFQGQEFAASSPFWFFADHNKDLAPLVREGRAKFLAQFPSIAQPEMTVRLPDPSARATFERCKLDLSERLKNAETYGMFRDLLRLRREDPVLSAPRRNGVDGAILGEEAFVLRFFGDDHGDRLLLINLGRDLPLRPAPEPLLAPPEGGSWQTLWSSEDPRYGGQGAPPLETDEGWYVPGQAAVLLGPR